MSADRRLVVAERSKRHFDVIDLSTGQTILTLPGRPSRESRARQVRFTDGGRFLWTLNPDSRYVYERGALEKYIKAELRQRKERGWDDLSDNDMQMWIGSYQRWATQETGSALVGWSLETGEAVRELVSRGRSIVAFDYCESADGDRIVTLEGYTTADGAYLSARIVMAQYDANTGKLITDRLMPKGFSPKSIACTDQGRTAIVITNGGSIKAYAIRDDIKLRWSVKNSSSGESWSTVGLICKDRNVYRLQESPWQHGSRKKIRASLIDTQTGKTVETTPLAFASDAQLSNVADGRLFIDSSLRRLGWAGSLYFLEHRNGQSVQVPRSGTLVCNLDRKEAQWLEGQELSAFGKDQSVLSGFGEYSYSGQHRRWFGRTPPSNRNGDRVLPNVNAGMSLLASSATSALLAGDEEIALVTLRDESKRVVLSQANLNDLIPGVETRGKFDFGDAIGTAESDRLVFYFAIPRRGADWEERLQHLKKRQPTSVENIEYRKALKSTGYVTMEAFPETASYVLGRTWEVFRVDGETAEISRIGSLPEEACVKLVASPAGLAAATVGDMHRTLSLYRWRDGDSLQRAWHVSNDRAHRNVQEFIATTTTHPLIHISPKLRFAFRPRKEGGYVLLQGLKTFSEKTAVDAFVFDSQGRVQSHQEIEYTPDSPTQRIFAGKKTERVDSTSGKMRFRIGSHPLGIDYASGIDAIVALESEPTRMQPQGSNSTALGDDDSDSLKVGISFRHLESGTVLRHTSARSLFRGVSGYRNETVRWPTRFSVDSAGDYCELTFYKAPLNTLVGYLPSMQQVLKVRESVPGLVTSNGRLIADGRRVPLDAVRGLGLKALDPDSADLLEQFDGGLPRQDSVYGEPSTLWYFAVGANRFRDDQLADLSYCQADVRAVGLSLRRRASAARQAYQPVVFTGDDTKSIDVQLQLEDLARRVRPGDTVVLNFATHGLRMRRGLYLATPMTDLSAVQGTAIGWPAIAETLVKLPARRVLLLLDTCHAGSFAETTAPILNGIAGDLRRSAGVTVIAASGEDQLSIESDEQRHGVFTHALLQILSRDSAPLPGDPHSFEELTQLVSSATGEQQEPVLVLHNPTAEEASAAQTERDPLVTPEPGELFAAKEAAKATRDAVRRRQESTTNSLGMVLRYVQPGTIRMGSTGSQIQTALKFDPKLKQDFIERETPQHEVTVTKGFYLGSHEVTIGQFKAFVQATGYRTEVERGSGGYGWNDAKKRFEGPSNAYAWHSPGWKTTDDHPVVNISWGDATAFCMWLTKTEGVTYRLPTEAEWEYAARAGSEGIFSFGDDHHALLNHANARDKSLSDLDGRATAVVGNDGYAFTAPVGRFESNQLGLFDIQGNVWEWCNDYRVSYVDSSPRIDPVGNVAGPYRVIRGGAYAESSRGCRLSIRVPMHQSTGMSSLGFRVAVSP